MQPHPPPSPPAEPATLQEELERFLDDHFEQPPTPLDPDQDVCELFRLLRAAFFAGCLVGQTHPMSYLPEMVEHIGTKYNWDTALMMALVDGALAAAGERP